MTEYKCEGCPNILHFDNRTDEIMMGVCKICKDVRKFRRVKHDEAQN